MIKENLKQLLERDLDITDTKLIIRYYQNYHCETKEERRIINKVLSQAPNWWSLIRTRCSIQNCKDSLIPKSPENQRRCAKKEEEVRNKFSPINNLIYWLCKKIWKD